MLAIEKDQKIDGFMNIIINSYSIISILGQRLAHQSFLLEDMSKTQTDIFTKEAELKASKFFNAETKIDIDTNRTDEDILFFKITVPQERLLDDVFMTNITNTITLKENTGIEGIKTAMNQCFGTLEDQTLCY